MPFSWEDMTPVAMLALDNFVLWVNAELPLQDRRGIYRRGEGRRREPVPDGRDRLQAEDQIITAAIEQGTGAKFTYVPFKGGGDVAAQLVGGHICSTVNNPIEQVSHWQGGATRPLCVFAAERVAVEGTDIKWGDIPTCKEAGLDIEYQMLRGIFMPPTSTRKSWTTTSASSRRCARRRSGRTSWRRAPSPTPSCPATSTRPGWPRPPTLHKDLMTNAGFLAK